MSQPQLVSLTQVERVNNIRNSSPKLLKNSLNQSQKENNNMASIANVDNRHVAPNNVQHGPEPPFGICFDIDGVIARGSVPIPSAVKAFSRLVDDRGQFRLPVAFVTNSLNRNSDRANQLTNMLGVKISADQMILAPSPLVMFKGLHDKFCLVVGQGQILEIANDLGFKNVCTVEDIAEAYPLLDVADHDNRKKLASDGYIEKDFPRVEAVLLLGEPKRWESALQLLVDVLRTGGRPNMATTIVGLDEQLPVVACNMDLQFMHQACHPRYGHGAFLVCLEALYKKITNYDLHYTALVGKPSEITFRYAEHVLTTQTRKLGYTEPIKTMYLIGDTPDSDIAGSNLYQQFVDRAWSRQRKNSVDVTNNNHQAPTETVTTDDAVSTSGGRSSAGSPPPPLYDADLPPCRNVPSDVRFHVPTVERVEPILVCTGVYQPKPVAAGSTPAAVASSAAGTVAAVAVGGVDSDAGSDPFSEDSSDDSDSASCDGEEDVKLIPFHGHRDFPHCADLYKPSRVCADIDAAVRHILVKQSYE